MTFKKTLFGALMCTAVAGCAHKVNLLDQVVSLNQPYRVIEHDFQTKYGAVYLPAPAAATEEKPQQAPEQKADETPEPISSGNPLPGIYETVNETPGDVTETKPAPADQSSDNLTYVDVEFFNESAVMKDHEDVVKKVKQHIKSDEFLIVGHSHGKSAVGVESLAAQRAQFVADVLFISGVPRKNIHFISSWSDGGLGHTIPKGARIIGIPKGLNTTIALITGLPQTEDRT